MRFWQKAPGVNELRGSVLLMNALQFCHQYPINGCRKSVILQAVAILVNHKVAKSQFTCYFRMHTVYERYRGS